MSLRTACNLSWLTYQALLSRARSYLSRSQPFKSPGTSLSNYSFFKGSARAQHGQTSSIRASLQHVGTTLLNIVRHNVAFVCTPHWAMLHGVGTCCVHFETSQTFCPTYANVSSVFVIDEDCHNTLGSSARFTQHCWT